MPWSSFLSEEILFGPYTLGMTWGQLPPPQSVQYLDLVSSHALPFLWLGHWASYEVHWRPLLLLTQPFLGKQPPLLKPCLPPSTACASPYSEPFLMSKRKYNTQLRVHYQTMGKLRTKYTLKIHPATRELVVIKLHARTNLKGSSTPSPGETSKKIWWLLSKNRPVGSHKQLQREKTTKMKHVAWRIYWACANKSKSPRFANIICWR